MKLELFKQSMKDKSVAVVGVGVSNVPLIKLLISCGAHVTAFDKRSSEELGQTYRQLHDMGVLFELGEEYLSKLSHEIIFKTPGMRYDIPELLLAKQNGSIITSEMELFFDICPAPIIAVTGSDGKTTTTTLIYEMLKQDGYTCHLGGNIGKPLIGELENIQPDHKVVLELSSFQLHTMKTSPQTAIITNITPNHLDMHSSMQEYIDAKKNIYKYQTHDGCVILNYDNEITREIGLEDVKTPTFFSRYGLDNGICLDGKEIVTKENGSVKQKILNINHIAIPGMHNVENYMAAIGAVWGQVSVDTILHVAKNFKGVAHRIEFVREINGVKYYNDSIASTPARSRAGLICFENKVILIAGGYDKKIPFDDFGEVINDNVKALILMGATSDKIEQAVINAENYDKLLITRASSMEDAVQKARDFAVSGDVIILSPACASFDMFKNFEERGNLFKEIVNNLK